MTEADIERRLTELRSEQLRTKDPRKKLIIRGDIQYWNNRLDKLKGKFRLEVM